MHSLCSQARQGSSTSIFSLYASFPIAFVKSICSNTAKTSSILFFIAQKRLEIPVSSSVCLKNHPNQISRNTSCFPTDLLSSNPGTHYKLFPKSASHLKIVKDGKLHGIYKSRNLQNIPLSAVCYNSCLQT